MEFPLLFTIWALFFRLRLQIWSSCRSSKFPKTAHVSLYIAALVVQFFNSKGQNELWWSKRSFVAATKVLDAFLLQLLLLRQLFFVVDFLNRKLRQKFMRHETRLKHYECFCAILFIDDFNKNAILPKVLKMEFFGQITSNYYNKKDIHRSKK